MIELYITEQIQNLKEADKLKEKLNHVSHLHQHLKDYN